MEITKTLIVSNHANHNLEWLKMTYDYGFSKENTIIYDRTLDDYPQKSPLGHLGQVIKSPNVGSNPYDIGRYIVDHYDSLSDISIFIKGNLLQKPYSNEKRFRYALNANWFVPIDGNVYNPSTKFYINDSVHIESTSLNYHMYENEVTDTKVYPRIKNFKEFIHDLFIIEKIPEYLWFAPAANYAVPKQNILKYSKNFYKKMMHYSDYNNNPIEAHWFERIYMLAWQGCLEENFSYIVE